LAASGIVLRTNVALAPFGVAAALLSLLLIGIRNAWDTVTHIVESDADAATKTRRHSRGK
jgi:hypothetical protein